MMHLHAFHETSRRSRRLGLILFCAVALVAVGCARRFPSERIPQMKVLIAPFEQPPSMSTDPRAIRGWWMGAETVRQNPRAGDAMADTLGRAMANLDFIHLYAPIEIKYYFAEKRQMLTKAYPYLKPPEVAHLMAEIPAQEFARELGADKVLCGRILRQYVGENRFIGWWWARLDAEVYLMDVGTGKKEWSHLYETRRQFSSDARLQEELAQQVIKDLKHDFFLPLAHE